MDLDRGGCDLFEFAQNLLGGFEVSHKTPCQDRQYVVKKYHYDELRYTVFLTFRITVSRLQWLCSRSYAECSGFQSYLGLDIFLRVSVLPYVTVR
jgi:hypothetical protein